VAVKASELAASWRHCMKKLEKQKNRDARTWERADKPVCLGDITENGAARAPFVESLKKLVG